MKTLGYIFAWIGLMLLSGCVTMTGWEFFIVPLGVPSISIVHALGINIFTFSLIYQYSKDDRESSDKMIGGYSLCIISLGLMYLYHWIGI